MAKKTVFITGSTKGPHTATVARFGAMAKQLKEQGYKVVQPTVIGEPEATWDASIRSDITALMTCDEIHLIHHWQGHKRSQILRDIALRIGITPVYH